MNVGDLEGIRIMLTASSWGTQESGAGRLQGGVRASGSKGRREQHQEISLCGRRRGGGRGGAMGRGRGKEKITKAGGKIRE